MDQFGENIRALRGRRPHLPKLVRGAAMGLALFACPSSAFGQSREAGAEALFREGKRFLDAQDFGRACPKLAQSYQLDEATGTLLALALCHEGAGKLALAWSEYTDAARRAHHEGRADREQAALSWASALEPKLSMMTILLPDGAPAWPGLEIREDGIVVAASRWGIATPAEPGEHVIEATALGRKPWKTIAFVGAPPARETVQVPALEAIDERPLTTTQPDRSHSGSVLRQAGVVAVAAGALGLAVGTYFGIQAIHKNDLSERSCEGNACDPAGKQNRLDAQAAGNASTALFVAGGALVTGGAIMYFVGGDPTPNAAALRALPLVGGATWGMALRGGF